MTSSARVAVTRRIPEAGLRVLRDAVEVRLWERDTPPDREELVSLLADCDGALTLLTERIDGPLLGALPRLRVVANMAVGYDNIDIDAASEHGVLVCNTPGVLTNATADHTWCSSKQPLSAPSAGPVRQRAMGSSERPGSWQPPAQRAMGTSGTVRSCSPGSDSSLRVTLAPTP